MQNSIKQQEKISITFKRLSIQIDLGGLSFCVFSPVQGYIESILELPLNLQAAPELISGELRGFLSQQSELRQDFDNIVVLHNNPYFALVPTEVFTNEQLGEYLKYSSYGQVANVVSYEEIPQVKAVNTYLPFSEVNTVIRETYGKFDYQHLSSLWLRITSSHSASKEQGVYAYYQKGGFYVAMFKKGELLFLNYFSYTDDTDMLYYLLFSIQQVELSPNEVPLFLAGSIIRRSPTFALLYKYVRNIFFLPYQGKPFCSGVEGVTARRNFALAHAFV